MADADNCCFKWYISEPFVILETLQASFYHGPAAPTQWDVFLEPVRGAINFCRFSISLQLNSDFDEREEIVAERVRIRVSLNGRRIGETQDSHYRFISRNSFSYGFELEAPFSPSTEPNHLTVKIKLRLPEEAAGDRNRNAPELDENDPRFLSKDFHRLFSAQIDPDMMLVSIDNRPFGVHSYIINQRWNNFDRLHSSHGYSIETVQILASTEVLFSILICMYSGVFRVSSQQLDNQPYFADLFRVIHHYKLYHVYKVLAPDDSHQKQWSKRHVLTATCKLPLTRVEGQPIMASSRTWPLNQNTGCDFIFQIRVRNANGPWLSYSLKSRSGFTVHVQVNLDLVRRALTPAGLSVMSVIEERSSVLPRGEVESGDVVFLGSPEILADMSPARGRGERREVRYFVRCILKFSDGSVARQILNEAGALQNDLEMFNILCDDMHKMMRTPEFADLRIQGGPAQWRQFLPWSEGYQAIFKARVPCWWNVVEDFLPRVEMPGVATTDLRNDALPYVLAYIHTGRVSTIPHYMLDDMVEFANRGNCHSLKHFLDRVRTRVR